MTIKKRKFSPGIRLKGSTTANTLEGEMRLDPSALTFKVYVDSAERELLTNNQAQTLSNKTINSASNTVTIDADTATVSNIETDNLKAGVLNTDLSGAATDTELPSALAVKTALAGQNEASEITYDNSTSGLTATDVQAAVDEVEGRVDTLETDTHTHSNKAILDATTASFLTADETKLDGIETGATTDQTGAEIKVAYEAEADTNAYTDAEKTKLTGIETAADVTDATNVAAAGATMDADTSLAGNGYFLDEDNMASDDATKVPSQQSVKAFVEGRTLDDTSDVSVASPNSGEVLTYNSISGDWESKTPEGGLKNYITNGKAEADTSGWTVYKNTVVGEAPDDFGGTVSGNLTFTRNTTDPLSGLADFKLSTTAANLQGEGVYYEFTLDKVDLATMLTGIIRKDSSDTGIADGDYRYYLASSSDAFASDVNIIRVNSGEDMNGSDNDNILQVQTDASDLTYRLCIHRAVTTATATDVYLDELELGPRSVQKGAAMSDWEAFTPTGSWTTNTTYSGYKRRVGDVAEYDIKVSTSGAPNATNLNIDVFDGIIDINKIHGEPSDNANLGDTTVLDAATGRYIGRVRWLSSTQVTATVMVDNSTYEEPNPITNTLPITFTSGDEVHIKFSVPILGWSSNVISSEDIGNREIIVRGEGNGGTVITAGTTSVDFTEVEDTTNSWNGTEFTAPEKGTYTICGGTDFTSSNGRIIEVHRDTGGGYSLYKKISDFVSTSTHEFSALLSLDKNDKIKFIIDHNGGTLSNSAETHWIHIQKIASPQTILETETVAARYTSNSGAVINNGATITYEDLDYDTHGTFSSGEYTVEVGGFYDVKASVRPNASATTVIEIQVNGVSKKRGFNATSSDSVVDATDTLKLEKGDVVKVINSTGVSITMTTGSIDNVFSIIRIK